MQNQTGFKLAGPYFASAASIFLLCGCGALHPPRLTSLAIDPPSASIPLGATVQLKALAVYSDGTSREMTQAVRWNSTNYSVASVDGSGLVTTSATVGEADVSASFGKMSASVHLIVGKPALASMTIAPAAPMVPLGNTEQLTATGTLTDRSTQDLTGSVTWSSSEPAVASVTPAGLAVSQSVGTATIIASMGSVRATAQLMVSEAALVSIGIAATNATMPLGTTQQLTASGTFTDGTVRDVTNSTTWSSLPSNFVAVDAQGRATANAIGTSEVSAAIGTVTGATFLTVSAPALISISITPGDPHLPLGGSNQLAAIGNYTDGSSQPLVQDLMWHADRPEVASIDTSGVATGQQIGTTGVEASAAGVVGTATLTVQPVEEINYFTSGTIDSTIRISNPGATGQDLCTMMYVFDQDQQLSECCGCLVRKNSLRSLSLNNDLLSNPLTGVKSTTGSLVLVTADYGSNPSCDATQITPAGTGAAWATHLQAGQGGRPVVTETPFSSSILSDQQAAGLQAQCDFIRQLGGGQGTCGCGIPH